jgi:hypothetical protein
VVKTSEARVVKTILNLMFMICVLACGECSAQWSRLSRDTIRLEGVIGKDSYQAYREAAKDGYSKVILRSEGGTPMPALMIALDMQKHRPQITVDGYCLSSCANYLFLASPASVVQCGALLMWHGSPSGSFSSNIEKMRLDGKNPQLIGKYEEWASRFDAMEREFFGLTGVDRKLLSDSVAIVRREKIVPESVFTFDEVTGDYSESVSSGLWVPTTKVISGYGVDVSNFCSSYDADIPKTLDRLGVTAPYTSAGP